MRKISSLVEEVTCTGQSRKTCLLENEIGDNNKVNADTVEFKNMDVVVGDQGLRAVADNDGRGGNQVACVMRDDKMMCGDPSDFAE